MPVGGTECVPPRIEVRITVRIFFTLSLSFGASEVGDIFGASVLEAVTMLFITSPNSYKSYLLPAASLHHTVKFILLATYDHETAIGVTIVRNDIFVVNFLNY